MSAVLKELAPDRAQRVRVVERPWIEGNLRFAIQEWGTYAWTCIGYAADEQSAREVARLYITGERVVVELVNGEPASSAEAPAGS
jgi:hypothetical protein